MRSIVHPRLIDRIATGFFPTTATIETHVDTRSASGASVPGWAALAGHVDIPAAVSAVPSRMNQARLTELTISTETHRIALAGAYPAIRADMRIRVASGPHAGIYDIVRPDLDIVGAMTVLQARVVTPVAAAGV